MARGEPVERKAIITSPLGADGQTLPFQINGRREALRTIGVGSAPPEFVHPAHNVTVVEGQEVTLMCSVSTLKDYKQLAWVHEESQTILSIGRHLYTRIPRLSLHADHHSAALTVSPVLSTDRGWYMCQLNTNPMTYTRSYLQVLVPPTLEDWSGSYVEVREGVSVRLTCNARAFPPALTTWRRSDAEPIFRTPKTVWVVEGADLVFESVRRVHGGAYTCHVDNKVTAPVSRTTHLTVTYAPVLWLGRELVGVKAGEDITLNCSSEANPPPSHYWSANGTNVTTKKSRSPRLRMLPPDLSFPGHKYQVDEMRLSTRTEVLLTIRSVGHKDFTHYRCHAVNPIGQAEGTIRLYGRFPVPKQASLTTQPPTNASTKVRVERPWRNNNRVTDVMPSRNTSKKASADDDQRKGRRLKNYPRHGGRFNDTTLIVDLIMDVEGGATTCYLQKLLRASDVVVVFHVLFLLVREMH
ncbi:lachesin-like [Penaeus indicus]|uniref:lachesin-like n=1 Tax=Penaeus indicus TaxID=29960 RepID=UPI00300CDE59